MPSYNQQLIVHLDVSDEWCPQFGQALFNTFVVHMDNRIECRASNIAHTTKLCGATGALEGKDAIQRDLDRLEKWNPMKLYKARSKVCIQSSVARRPRKGILPLHSTLLRPHLECSIQPWDPQHEMDMEWLEGVQRRSQR
ncbi:hypothetical protein HGM15179_005543 [Zosterops borbonicus]|uniref:Uncharacterized protein n=1 Tax=Zosterops borbonicus TaxID=364589 RepID=A0A8K1GP61_9PASS|nr:hypothetical protein HGM15179_005543 [Zosterops borbonicus]